MAATTCSSVWLWSNNVAGPIGPDRPSRSAGADRRAQSSIGDRNLHIRCRLSDRWSPAPDGDESCRRRPAPAGPHSRSTSAPNLSIGHGIESAKVDSGRSEIEYGNGLRASWPANALSFAPTARWSIGRGEQQEAASATMRRPLVASALALSVRRPDGRRGSDRRVVTRSTSGCSTWPAWCSAGGRLPRASDSTTTATTTTGGSPPSLLHFQPAPAGA